MTDVRGSEAVRDLRDCLIVIAGFAIVGLVGAFVWRAVVDLPRFIQTAHGPEMDAIQLAREIRIDGWFAAIAAPAGFLSGLLVTWRLPRRPRLAVVGSAVGGLAAALVMTEVGRWIGPDSPGAALRHAPVGASAPVQLALHADGVAFLWPALATLGCLIVLLIVVPQEGDVSSPATVAEQPQ